MEQQKPMIYGIIGALLGGFVVWLLTANHIMSPQKAMVNTDVAVKEKTDTKTSTMTHDMHKDMHGK